MVTKEHKFDVILAGGRVIDPANDIDQHLDIAISDGRIVAVESGLEKSGAKQVHDISGLMAVPGLIDLHTHFYHKATAYGVDPNPVAARSAIATMVDAGSAGAGNFAGLRDYVIEKSPFRLLTYINISYPGIFAFDWNYSVGEAAIRDLLSVKHCVEVAKQNRDLIVGVKVRLGIGTSGEIGMEALEAAIEAAEALDLPVMTHIGKPPPTYRQILGRMRPGDVLTHCFRPSPNGPVDDSGAVLDALIEARERGVLFDIGHGMGAFGFASAEAALNDGFKPDIISSDLHALCHEGPAFDLLHTMSKLIRCGLSLKDVIAMATHAPAVAMRRNDLGNLSVGASADISLLDTVEAEYPLEDVTGSRLQSKILLRPHGLYMGGQFINPISRDWESQYYSE